MKLRMRTAIWLVVLLLCFCLTAATAFADGDENTGDEETVYTDGSFSYVLFLNKTETEARVVAYSGSTTTVTIPEELGGYPVTEIGEGAFSEVSRATKIVFPETLRVIGERAFEGCTALKTLVFSAGLERVEAYAFDGCKVLKAAPLPDSVRYIGEGAFSGCTAMASFQYPLSLAEAGSGIFAKCEALTAIHVPEGVTTLPGNVFCGADYLEKVYLPKTLTTAEDNVFDESQVIDIYGYNGSPAEEMAAAWGYEFYSEGSVYLTFVGTVTDAVSGKGLYNAKITIYGVLDDGSEGFFEQEPEGEIEPWYAQSTGQINPLYTDWCGGFGWSVKSGWWMVQCEASGYETCRSRWICVNGESVRFEVPIQPYRFTLSFNVNGAECDWPESITEYCGTELTIPRMSLSREGYYFLGWSTSPYATEPRYKGGDTLKITADTQLFAVWSRRKYTLSFDRNGGTGTIPASASVLHGDTATVGKATLSRDGHYFMGWATTPDATVAQYKTGSTIVMTSAVKLYAVWKPQNRKLSFNLNGGKGTLPSALTVPYGTQATIGKCSVSRDHCYFLGWSSNPDATAAEYKTGSKLTLTDNVTLYAVWKPETRKLSFNLNGGMRGAPAAVTVAYGQTATVPKCSAARDDYYFLGWATSATATTAQYKSGSQIEMTQNVTLYAVWKKR
ncbi:MAG: InlB B-repeat-containing protein [Lachnospiraceae bacterium]|nr:InlB B-repeat-containing protein [Lachnospiraceae bacterium]